MTDSKEHLSIVIVGHVDAGKCFSYGQPIMKYDGSVVAVQDIKKGDTLMGDDSSPRIVQDTTRGNGDMYKVTQTKGDSYVVNKDHILTLKASNYSGVFYDTSRDRFRARWLEISGLKEKTFNVIDNKNATEKEAYEFLEAKLLERTAINYKDVVDISVEDYLKMSNSSQQAFKGFHNSVDFDSKSVDIDPYVLGYWLGDGHSSGARITTADSQVVEYFTKCFSDKKLFVKKIGSTDYSYGITTGTDSGGSGRNVFLNFLKDNNLIDNKHIPDSYLFNSKENRLRLLAGLIDSDGSLSNGTFDYITKLKPLADQIVYLAKSLGYFAQVIETLKKSQTMEEAKTYYRICISGNELCEIPCLIPRKQCSERETKKDASMHGITITKEGVDNYYGFSLDGNGRFLLGDFTVTHNSTTTGHLLFKLGGINDREMQKLQEKAKELGKESFGFAFYMDNNKEERERGITINTNTKEFFSDKYHYTIIDAPGHRDFIKNMISGAAQADVALLLVPASKGSFETSIQKGDHKTGKVQGQTRQHARLLKLLGVEQLIVAVNKMDDPSVNYSEERYNEVKNEVTTMLQKIGFKTPRVPFIPMSGFKGENLTEKTDNMPWYKGYKVQVGKDKFAEGHTLLEALNNVARVPKRDTKSNIRVPVSGVFKIRGVGDVITGRVEQGVLKPGVNVKFVPSGATGKIFSVEMHHKSVEAANPGDNVGLNVKGLTNENMPVVGDVIVLDSEDARPVKSFTAQVMVQEHPGELHAQSLGKKGGFCPVVHVRTARSPCKMTHINWRMGKETGGNKLEDAPYVKQNDQAEIVFEPQTPFYVEDFKSCPGLGRIAVMDSNSLVMLGKITKVEYKDL